MSEFSKETLENLAKLCRIDCSEEELQKLLVNLKSILKHIDHMQEVDTQDVPECNHVSEALEPFTREDEATGSLSRDTFLKNSPSHVGGMIRVPPVIKF